MLIPLIEDTLLFSGDELLNVGQGPLSQLYKYVIDLLPKKRAVEHSQHQSQSSLLNTLVGLIFFGFVARSYSAFLFLVVLISWIKCRFTAVCLRRVR